MEKWQCSVKLLVSEPTEDHYYSVNLALCLLFLQLVMKVTERMKIRKSPLCTYKNCLFIITGILPVGLDVSHQLFCVCLQVLLLYLKVLMRVSVVQSSNSDVQGSNCDVQGRDSDVHNSDSEAIPLNSPWT